MISGNFFGETVSTFRFLSNVATLKSIGPSFCWGVSVCMAGIRSVLRFHDSWSRFLLFHWCFICQHFYFPRNQHSPCQGFLSFLESIGSSLLRAINTINIFVVGWHLLLSKKNPASLNFPTPYLKERWLLDEHHDTLDGRNPPVHPHGFIDSRWCRIFEPSTVQYVYHFITSCQGVVAWYNLAFCQETVQSNDPPICNVCLSYYNGHDVYTVFLYYLQLQLQKTYKIANVNITNKSSIYCSYIYIYYIIYKFHRSVRWHTKLTSYTSCIYTWHIYIYTLLEKPCPMIWFTPPPPPQLPPPQKNSVLPGPATPGHSGSNRGLRRCLNESQRTSSNRGA